MFVKKYTTTPTKQKTVFPQLFLTNKIPDFKFDRAFLRKKCQYAIFSILYKNRLFA